MCSHRDDTLPSSFPSPGSFKGIGTLFAASHLFLSPSMSIFSLQSTASVCSPVQRCEAKLHMRLEREELFFFFFLHSFDSLRNVDFIQQWLEYMSQAHHGQCSAEHLLVTEAHMQTQRRAHAHCVAPQIRLLWQCWV